MGKWRQGLKIDFWATKKRAVLFNLKQEFYPAQPSSSQFAKSAFFHNFAIPGEQMSTLWANGDRGLKSTSGNKAAAVLFNLKQEFYPAQPSSSTKIR